MKFIDKIFTKDPKKPPVNNKAALDFIASCNASEKWFEDDYQSLSGEANKKVIDYITQFGLEKSSKSFALMPELKTSIADYFKRCDIDCSSKNIIISSGIFELLQDLYNVVGFKEGEKVLFALPLSSYFIQECHDNNIATEFLNTDAKNNWKIIPSELETALQTQTIKILFLNYPNNISGAILTKEEAEKLAEIIAKYPNLLVVVDESLRILNSDSQQFSLGAIAEISSRVITIGSLKGSGLGNLDIYFACVKDESEAKKLSSETTNISTLNQQIAIAALAENKDNKEHIEEIIEHCRQNHQQVTEELKEINNNLGQKFNKKEEFVKPYLKSNPVSDSMLVQFDGLKGSASQTGVLNTDLDMAKFLKSEAGIAMMPGQCYLLPEEEMVLKFHLLKSKQELKDGFKKINQALVQLKMLSKSLSSATGVKVEGTNEKSR
ncbi:MAG: aminotransferase, class [Rickettsiaceae bacterium]|jgi:aspartate aminotransferase|nr:aminotransferase, class [Rickettsiaceae bacterium]